MAGQSVAPWLHWSKSWVASAAPGDKKKGMSFHANNKNMRSTCELTKAVFVFVPLPSFVPEALQTAAKIQEYANPYFNVEVLCVVEWFRDGVCKPLLSGTADDQGGLVLQRMLREKTGQIDFEKFKVAIADKMGDGQASLTRPSLPDDELFRRAFELISGKHKPDDSVEEVWCLNAKRLKHFIKTSAEHLISAFSRVRHGFPAAPPLVHRVASKSS